MHVKAGQHCNIELVLAKTLVRAPVILAIKEEMRETFDMFPELKKTVNTKHVYFCCRTFCGKLRVNVGDILGRTDHR